jgi:CHAD domain-containing protein
VDTDGIEQEVKLEAGIGFRIPDLAGAAIGITVRSEPEQRLQAIYVDTPDLRLIRSGLTLRHRADRSLPRDSGEWTLKLPEDATGEGLSRRELNWPGPWGAVPEEVAGLVRAYRRTANLVPVARLVSHRRRTLLCGRQGEALLEIDDDVVSVMDGRRLAARFREVEVEVVGAASSALLAEVVARLGEAGALPGDGRPKVARAIGYRATEPPDVTPTHAGRHASMGEAVQAAIANGYVRLVAHDLGVRLDEDPEDVHQARVATRRLRSDLRTFRPFLPQDWSEDIRQELGWLAAALGRARDADVLLERMRHQIEQLESRDVRPAGALIAGLIAEQDEARAELLEVMDTERYGELLERLAAAARELPPVKTPTAPVAPEPEAMASETALGAVALPAGGTVDGPAVLVGEDQVAPEPPGAGESVASTALATAAMDAGDPGAIDLPPSPPSTNDVQPRFDRDGSGRDQAPAVVRGPWRHLRRAVSALDPVPSDEALHEIRIRAKRLRYACEAVEGVVGRPATNLARAAAELQGVLGDFHDAIVGEDWLRAASVKAPSAQALVAGQLIATERQIAARCRGQWSASWKRIDHKKLRAWLR